jgi:hypothetical protein
MQSTLLITLLTVGATIPICSVLVAGGLWMPANRFRDFFRKQLGFTAIYSAVLCIILLLVSRFCLWHWIFSAADELDITAGDLSLNMSDGTLVNRLWLYAREARETAGYGWLIDSVSLLLCTLCAANAIIAAWNRKMPNQALEPTATAVTDRAAHAPRQP